MKASRFNIVVDQPKSEDVLLFNTLYGGLTAWDRSEFPIAQHCLDEPNRPGADQASILVKKKLVDSKYIVEDEADEIAIVKNRKLLGMRDTNRLDIVIMPNLTCNLACPYCYESHTPSAFMVDSTEQAIKCWLERSIPMFKVVLLNWFGGEPLLSYKRITSISKHAQEVCDANSVALLTNITTNGYLLDERRIRELTGMGILSYQITVDGPASIHNKMRPLRKGGGSFDRIFDNILILARADKRVRVSLRVNFNHHNLHTIPELLTLFPEDVRSQLRVVYEPIFGEECLSATQNIPADKIASHMVAYYRLAKELGYDVTLGGLGIGKLVYCYAERENQLIISYNGDLFKCTVCGFSREERIGILSSEGEVTFDQERWNKWFGMELFDEKCAGCKFLPLCMGGCRKTRREDASTGSFCALVPTNTSFVLKSVALYKFADLLHGHYVESPET